MTILEKFLLCALGEYGTKEIVGGTHNPRILEYHKTTRLRATDDETPWCSAAVNWVVRQCGEPGTDSAAARSWLTYGKEIKEPVPGCIVVLKRGNNPMQAHVAFFVRKTGDTIYILGGNQSDAFNIATRPTADVLSYRVPENYV